MAERGLELTSAAQVQNQSREHPRTGPGRGVRGDRRSAPCWLGPLSSSMPVPGKCITSVKVDVPRHLPRRRAHAAQAAGSGKKPTPVSHGSPLPCPCQPAGPAWTWAEARNAQESPHCAWVQAEAAWGARGFQGDTGQTPCVLTTVTRTAHWETQCKAPRRQRGRLINTPQGGSKQGFPPNAMVLPNPKKGGGLQVARVPHPPPTNMKKSSTATTPESQKPARGCPLCYGRLCQAQSTPTPPQH